MILPDHRMRELIYKPKVEGERLKPVERPLAWPIAQKQIQPASLDLRIAEDISLSRFDFKMVHTLEKVIMPPDVCGFIDGRSSAGRLGLFVHHAVWIDPGFEGVLTLEMFNAGPAQITFPAGSSICQMVFLRLESPAEAPYAGHYQGQTHAQESKHKTG